MKNKENEMNLVDALIIIAHDNERGYPLTEGELRAVKKARRLIDERGKKLIEHYGSLEEVCSHENLIELDDGVIVKFDGMKYCEDCNHFVLTDGTAIPFDQY